MLVLDDPFSGFEGDGISVPGGVVGATVMKAVGTDSGEAVNVGLTIDDGVEESTISAAVNNHFARDKWVCVRLTGWGAITSSSNGRFNHYLEMSMSGVWLTMDT
jgi:hypothetical protein